LGICSFTQALDLCASSTTLSKKEIEKSILIGTQIVIRRITPGWEAVAGVQDGGLKLGCANNVSETLFQTKVNKSSLNLALCWYQKQWQLFSIIIEAGASLHSDIANNNLFTSLQTQSVT